MKTLYKFAICLLALGLGACSTQRHASYSAFTAEMLPQKYQDFVEDYGGSKFVDVHGARIHYLAFGNPNAEPYVFVHGTPVNAFVWRKVIAKLSTANKRIILVDLIGYGLSDRPDIAYNFTEYSRYLTGFIDQLKLKNIHFIAHDIGGQASFGYAESHATNIRSIAAFETLFRPFDSFDEFDFKTRTLFKLLRSQYWGDLIAVKLNQMIPALLKMGVEKPMDREDREVYSFFTNNRQSKQMVLNVPRSTPVQKTPFDQYAFVNRYSEFLEKSNIPKLVITANPGVVPDIQADSAALFSHTSVKEINDAGHFIQEDQPSKLAEILEDFWLQINEEH